jgi:hypothetical protein
MERGRATIGCWKRKAACKPINRKLPLSIAKETSHLSGPEGDGERVGE